jgi:preprotein translocase subunit SecG
MHTFLIALHVFLCLVLIGVILLQPGKDGAASLGGGGGNQGFSPRGQGNALSQATTVVAVMFMGTSITLAWLGTETDEAGDELQEDILRLQEEASKINAVETPKEAAPALRRRRSLLRWARLPRLRPRRLRPWRPRPPRWPPRPRRILLDDVR